MERRTLLIFVIAAVLLSTAMAWLTLSGGHWRGRHAPALDVLREERSVSAFHKLELNGSADVTLVQGAATSVAIETAGGAPVVSVVHDGTLTIETRDPRAGWKRFFNRGRRVIPRITVTFAELTDIEAAGAIKLRSSGIRTPSLHVDIAGAGTLDLDNLQTERLFVEGAGTVKANVNGRATDQRVEISGAGNYHAPALASETARVDVSGAGNVVINASKTLKVDISGAGAVAYVGNPSVEKSISGMGNVRQLTHKGEVRVNDSAKPPAPDDRRHGHMLVA
ncbi:MAG: head GIN domain-containing protein [Betaproteobacteria bacterium]